MNARLKTFLIYTLLTIVAYSIGLYFRLYPLFYLTSNEASEKAAVIVLGRLKATVLKIIQENYPHLGDIEKQRLVKKQFALILKKDSANVRKAIQTLSLEINKTLPGRGKTYLLASDSFYYFGLTQK